MAQFSAQQIVQLWTANGGNPLYGNTFAGIAMAESGGNSTVINNNPSTGDYSVGLWQINYYDGLYASRTAAFGPPGQLANDPNAQARAAISLSNNGTNLSPWKGDSYVKGLNGGVAQDPVSGSSTSPSTADTTAYSPVIPTGPGAESGGVFPGSVFGPAVTIAPSPQLPLPSATNGLISSSAVNGFGDFELGDVTINGGPMVENVTAAISDIIVERNIAAASTVTLQLTDPQRQILRSGIFNYFDVLLLDGLLFALVETTKTGDQLQIIFEAAGIAFLRIQTGVTATTNTTDITGFAEQLVSAIPGLGFVGEPTPLSAPIAVGRGTTSNPDEDSWTCLVRIAATAGWRVFESANVVYFGGDDFWASFPSQGILTEPIAPNQPQQAIQNIDFDYDIGQPFGNITVTGISNLWQYPPGAVVTVQGCGPANGNWLVSDIQRDYFSPQMTCTLQTPILPALFLNPNQNSTGIVTGG